MRTVSIVITCHGEAKDLSGILNTIENQRIYKSQTLINKRNGKKHTVNFVAGPKYQGLREVVIASDGVFEGRRPEYTYLVECKKEGGVGHHTREPGINFCGGEYVVLTNSDNLFCHGWLYHLNNILDDDVGLVYWDVVNNLWNWGCNPVRTAGSKLKRGYIDLSSAAVKTEIAKEVGFKWRNYDGDFDYIINCARLCRKRNLKVIHLPLTLGVHN